LDDQKIAIPFPRHIEAMTGHAPALSAVRFDRLPIDRTGKIGGGDDVHCRLGDMALRIPYVRQSLKLNWR
jgi:hypothetical protein